MASLGLREKYAGRFGVTHGEKLRTERRTFATEQAGALAKARMAELERTQVGETKRRKITEAGTEKRHLREFAAPGDDTKGGFRYAELEAKKSAGARLSAANQSQVRKQQLEAYDIETEAAFSPYMEYGPEGETTMPSQLREIYNVGRAMSLNDPKGAQEYIKEELVAFKKSAGQETRLKQFGEMSKEQLSAYEQSLLGGAPAGAAALPAPAAPSAAPSRAGGLSTAATRLRAEYEKKHPTPIIGAETLGRFKEAWRTRRESPYVTLGG